MAKAGSSKKAVYVTHKKQSALQRRVNKVTGVKEAKGLSRNEKQNIRRAFGVGRDRRH